MADTEECSNCRHWTPWGEVQMAYDGPRMIGHCVVMVPIPGHDDRSVPQGLTGYDFHCAAYKMRCSLSPECPCESCQQRTVDEAAGINYRAGEY